MDNAFPIVALGDLLDVHGPMGGIDHKFQKSNLLKQLIAQDWFIFWFRPHLSFICNLYHYIDIAVCNFHHIHNITIFPRCLCVAVVPVCVQDQAQRDPVMRFLISPALGS